MKKATRRLLFYGLAGGVSGLLLGMLIVPISYLVNKGNFNNLLPVLQWGIRLINLVSLLVAAYLMYQNSRTVVTYEQTEDEDQAEELYIIMNRRKGTIFILQNIAMGLVFVTLFTTLGAATGQLDSLFFMAVGFDFIFLVALIVEQMMALKTYGRIRGLEVPLVPTIKEVKHNIMQADTAELEADQKMAHEVLMTLNTQLLPTLYAIIFLYSEIAGQVDVLAYLLVLVIHIYINLMSFKSTRAYFK